tara:strand:- start:1179 stop:1328 length:150 start_codon:yes stop_codon:yes gene_type:complete
MVNENHTIENGRIDAGINAQHLEAQVWELFTHDNPHKIFCGYCEQEIRA